MSRIPRNKLAVGARHKKRTGDATSGKRNTTTLENLFTKHSVGEFTTCRRARLVDHNGKFTEIMYEQVIGNMRASILVFKSAALHPDLSDATYDLITIERNKKAKEEKKLLDDMETTKDRINTLHESENKFDKSLREDEVEAEAEGAVAVTEVDETHAKMLDLLKVQEDLADGTGNDDIESEIIPEVDPIVETIVEPEAAVESDAIVIPETDYKPVPTILPKRIAGNKYHRNFLTEIVSKFKLVQETKYRYLEIKIDATPMVIDKVGVFRILGTFGKDQTTDHILIVGDLQMKSTLIKQIDPNHGAEDVIKNQTEFAESVRDKVDAENPLMPDFDQMPELVAVGDVVLPVKESSDFSFLPPKAQPGIIVKASAESETDSDPE